MDYTYDLIWGAGKPFQYGLKGINTVTVYIKVICGEKSVLQGYYYKAWIPGKIL
jgi:hypothetical protein